MAVETEKKFLLLNSSWKEGAPSKYYRQGYLNRDGHTVRVRIVETTGYLTIKGPTENGSKLEFEYEIPLADATEMLDKLSVSSIVEKYRYLVNYAGFTWEIDEFLGENKGLVMAEIELSSIDEEFEKPEWIGREVTEDHRYYNAYLAQIPFCDWPENR